MIKSFKSYFELSSDQINDLYNYITEDGKKPINFVDFKELVLFLEQDKQEKNQKMIEITVTHDQYQFIQDNLYDLVRLRTKEELQEWLGSKAGIVGLVKDAWSDTLVNDFFNMMSDFLISEKDSNPQALMSYLNVIESRSSDMSHVRKSSLNVENQNHRAIEAIKLHLSSYIEELNVIKSKEPSESVYSVFKSSLKLSDNITSEVR